MNPARSLTLNNLPFVLSVDCAAQRGAGRDGAVSPVTGRAAAANSQYGAATRAQGEGTPLLRLRPL